MTTKLRNYIYPLFTSNGQKDWPLLILWIFITLLICVNAFIQNPEMGYDAIEHKRIIAILPERIPTRADTYEFFSPPLPYLLPAIGQDLCVDIVQPLQDSEVCSKFSGKLAQGINALFAIIISLWLLHLADVLAPGQSYFRLAVLALFGILTVHYKTFAMIRGEPYVAFFSMLAVVYLAALLQRGNAITWRDGCRLGLILSGMALSRQWGLLALPAVGVLFLLVWRANPALKWQWLQIVATAAAVTVVLGGSWYFFLLAQYGSLTPFVFDSAGFSFANHSPSFYRNTGLGNWLLFREPTRRTFDNMFFPLFYSELWGDYWGYFVFVRERTYMGARGFANQAVINPLLGRANLLGLLPTLLYLAGFLAGLRVLWLGLLRPTWNPTKILRAFITAIILFVGVGYLWFLISYPLKEPQGDHIKTVYLIHALHLLPLLAASELERLRHRWPWVAKVLWVWILLTYILNIPIWISRYPWLGL